MTTNLRNSLEALIALARTHQMTPEEQDVQVRSFAYGNTHLENESITRADIDEAAEALKAGRDPASCS